MLIRYESTTGLTNVGYRILNADKTEHAALTTVEVTEISPGGYGVTVADSVLAGRTVEWYEGATYIVAESFPASLTAAQTGEPAAALAAYDPPTRAEATADALAIIAALPPAPDNASIALARKVLTNKTVESASGDTVTVYDDDGTTPLGVFTWSQSTRTRGKLT